jgi:biopolymer transport protein ExbD
LIEFDEHESQHPGIDLTPMIDVVFLLLIFFLLTSVYAKPMMPLNLPEAQSAVVSADPPVTIAIESDGTVHVNNQTATLQELHGVLSKLYSATETKDLNLMSDKSVPFGKVVEVLDLAKQAGVENISVITEKKK